MRWLYQPPVAFLIMLAVAWGLMRIGRWIAAPSRPEAGKYRHYACGEEQQTQAIQPNYSRFFAVAFSYSVLHVAVLMVAVGFAGVGAKAGIAYLLIMSFSVFALISELELV